MKYPVIKPQVEVVRTTQGGILFDRSNGMHLLVTATEALILALCDGTHTEESIVDYVARTYAIPRERCAQDVPRYLSSATGQAIINVERPVRVDHGMPPPEAFADLKAGGVLVPEKIMTLGLSPTYDCSLRCAYCFANSGDPRITRKSLNIETVKRLLREAADLGAKRVDIGGGDPINYKPLPEIVRESLDLGFREVSISTKGVALTKETVRLLRLAGLDKIQLSIDTVNPDIYDDVVGRKGMYERMIRGWYNLRQEGFAIQNRATVTTRTIRGVPDMLAFTYAMGISNVRVVGVQHFGRGDNDMMPRLEDMASLRKQVDRMGSEYPNAKWFVGDARFGDPYPCEGDISRIWIHPDGRVSLCDVAGAYLDEFPVFDFGNVYTEPLREIWTKKIPPLFRMVRDPRCGSCPISMSCRSGCPLSAVTHYGDVMKAVPNCDLLKG